jgi:hypothetical protein
MKTTGNKKVDLYNTVTGKFIAKNVTSSASIQLAPQNAAIIICVPAGGKITYDGTNMLVNGVAVDYMFTKSSH